jgi:hypothetical protein
MTLAGASTGYRAWDSVCANNDTAYYSIWAVDLAGNATGDWETGKGTWATGGTLTRTTVIASSNSNNAVDWAAGRKLVAMSATDAALEVFPDGLTIAKTSGVGIKVNVDTPAFGWRDIIGSITPKATGAGSPTRTVYNGGTLADYAFVANDLVDFTFHIPHDYVPGTDLYFHVHWSHNGTAISGNAVFTTYWSYAKGHNQANFSAEKTSSITYATTDIATTPRYRHRVDEIQMSTSGGSASLLDTDAIEVDGIVIVTLKLTTLPTITGGSLFIHMADLHYQSTNMATAGKAPNFYA